MMPHNGLTDNRAPEECAASIFRVGYHKHGRHKLFQNAGINLPDWVVSHTRRQPFSH